MNKNESQFNEKQSLLMWYTHIVENDVDIWTKDLLKKYKLKIEKKIENYETKYLIINFINKLQQTNFSIKEYQTDCEIIISILKKTNNLIFNNQQNETERWKIQYLWKTAKKVFTIFLALLIIKERKKKEIIKKVINTFQRTQTEHYLASTFEEEIIFKTFSEIKNKLYYNRENIPKTLTSLLKQTKIFQIPSTDLTSSFQELQYLMFCLFQLIETDLHDIQSYIKKIKTLIET